MFERLTLASTITLMLYLLLQLGGNSTIPNSASNNFPETPTEMISFLIARR